MLDAVDVEEDKELVGEDEEQHLDKVEQLIFKRLLMQIETTKEVH